MLLNIHIIYDKLAEIIEQKRVNSSYLLNLRGVNIFSDSTANIKTDYIYICDNERLERLLSFPNVTAIVYQGEGDINEFQLPESVSIIKTKQRYEEVFLYTLIQNVFDAYHKWYDELIDAILRNDSIQNILDIGVRVLENPIALCKSSSFCIAWAGHFPPNYHDIVWDSVFDGSFSLNGEIINRLKRSSVKKNHNIYLNEDESGLGIGMTHIYIYENASRKNSSIGYIGSTEVNKRFTRGQISLNLFLAQCLGNSVLILDELKYCTTQVKQMALDLISGKRVNPKLIDYAFQKRNNAVPQSFYLYVIDISEIPLSWTSEVKKHETMIPCLEKTIGNKGIVLSFDKRVVVVIYGKNKEEPTASHIKMIRKAVGYDQCCIGISGPFGDFSEIQAYYMQAVTAIEQGRKSDSANKEFRFADYVLEYMLKCVSEQNGTALLCHPLALKLLAYDKKNKTDYLKVAEKYFNCMCSITQTAEALFMHRNSLTYKLNKIEDILKTDLKEVEDPLLFWISCKMMIWKDLL